MYVEDDIPRNIASDLRDFCPTELWTYGDAISIGLKADWTNEESH